MVSPTLARAMQRVDEEAAASDAVMAEARASIPAADPALANLPRFPSSDPKEGESRSRVYILISKQGNTTKFARDSIVSSVELELEAAGWESSPGLPAIQQCPETGPFPLVIDKGGAEALGKNIDLFDDKGDPTNFEVFRIDANRKRIYDTPKPGAAEAAARRASTEQDERRRTILTFYDLPLSLCGKTIADGTLASTVRLLERAQFMCVGVNAKRVSVNQPVVKGRTESKLAVYTTLKEGTTTELMKSFKWEATRFVPVAPGERPLQGTMARACSLLLERAPCCLRTTLACPGREVCTAREDAWRRAQYDPTPPSAQTSRPDKRTREMEKEAAAKQQRTASKTKALEHKLARLCEDFREGRVSYTPCSTCTPHAN
jgi:hypothetical protein